MTSKRGQWTDDRVQMLAHLAAATRPPGARGWDEPGVVAQIRKLIDRGFGMTEVIDRTFAHAWDATVDTPGALLSPKSRRPVESSPVPFPVARAEECRLHPGQTPGLCTACAADEKLRDWTPPPTRREEPPSYDDDGRRLRHRPLHDLYREARDELAPPTDTTPEESTA